MASITPYADGRYRAVVRRTGYETRSAILPTKVKAQAWARQIEAEMDAVKYRDTSGAKKLTVTDILDRFSREVCPTRKGCRWEQVRIAKFKRQMTFAKRRLVELRPEDIRDWRDQALKTLSPASVNRELNLLSGVFSHAMKEWSAPLAENPVQQVKRPAGSGRARNRRWSEQEIADVLRESGWKEDAQPTTGREYVGWAVLVAVETAMRLGELCALRIADFHPAERYVALHDTKNGDARQVPLSRRALEIITFITAGRPKTERIFPLKANTLGTYFRLIRNRLGIADLHFHDTRHEATTRLSKKLPNVLELSAVTGHRSLQSLKRYYHPEPASIAAKLD